MLKLPSLVVSGSMKSEVKISRIANCHCQLVFALNPSASRSLIQYLINLLTAFQLLRLLYIVQYVSPRFKIQITQPNAVSKWRTTESVVGMQIWKWQNVIKTARIYNELQICNVRNKKNLKLIGLVRCADLWRKVLTTSLFRPIVYLLQIACLFWFAPILFRLFVSEIIIATATAANSCSISDVSVL